MSSSSSDSDCYGSLVAEVERLDRLLDGGDGGDGSTVPCPSCHLQVRRSMLEDHRSWCSHELVECFLCHSSPLYQRSTLWSEHLSKGRCPSYVIHCPSFRCKRTSFETKKKMSNEDVPPPPPPPPIMILIDRLISEGYPPYQVYSAAMSVRITDGGDSDLATARTWLDSFLSNWKKSNVFQEWSQYLLRMGLVQQVETYERLKQKDRSKILFKTFCLSGCDIKGSKERKERQEFEHYKRHREEIEAKRFFKESTIDTNTNNSDNSSSSSPSSSSSTISLRSCPTCHLRICVRSSSAESSSSSSSSEDGSIVSRPSSPSSSSSSSSSRHALYQPYLFTDNRIYGGHPKRLPRSIPGTPWRHEVKTKLIWNEEETRQHIEQCTKMAEDSEERHGVPPSSSSSSSSSDAPSSPPLTGIFARVPLVDDIDLSLPSSRPSSIRPSSSTPSPFIPQRTSTGPATTMTKSSEERTSTMPPLSSMRMTFSHLLTQVCLLQLGERLLRIGSDCQPTSNDIDVATQLFRSGGSLSDLLQMYDSSGKILSNLPRKMFLTQSKQLDLQRLMNILSPIQRPLVRPYLDTILIPDLANIVLEYF